MTVWEIIFICKSNLYEPTKWSQNLVCVNAAKAVLQNTIIFYSKPFLILYRGVPSISETPSAQAL